MTFLATIVWVASLVFTSGLRSTFDEALSLFLIADTNFDKRVDIDEIAKYVQNRKKASAIAILASSALRIGGGKGSLSFEELKQLAREARVPAAVPLGGPAQLAAPDNTPANQDTQSSVFPVPLSSAADEQSETKPDSSNVLLRVSEEVTVDSDYATMNGFATSFREGAPVARDNVQHTAESRGFLSSNEEDVDPVEVTQPEIAEQVPEPSVVPVEQVSQPAAVLEQAQEPGVAPSEQAAELESEPVVTPQEEAAEVAAEPAAVLEQAQEPAASPVEQAAEVAGEPAAVLEQAQEPAVSPVEQAAEPAAASVEVAGEPAAVLEQAQEPVVAPVEQAAQPAVEQVAEPVVAPVEQAEEAAVVLEAQESAVAPVEQASEPVAVLEQAQEPVASVEQAAEPAAEAAGEPTVAPVEQVSEPAAVLEQAQEPAAASVEQAAEPAAEAAWEPTASAVEQASQPAVAPVEQVAEPAMAPVEQASEPAAVLEQAQEPAVASVVQVVEPAAEAAWEPTVSAVEQASEPAAGVELAQEPVELAAEPVGQDSGANVFEVPLSGSAPEAPRDDVFSQVNVDSDYGIFNGFATSFRGTMVETHPELAVVQTPEAVAPAAGVELAQEPVVAAVESAAEPVAQAPEANVFEVPLSGSAPEASRDDVFSQVNVDSDYGTFNGFATSFRGAPSAEDQGTQPEQVTQAGLAVPSAGETGKSPKPDLADLDAELTSEVPVVQPGETELRAGSRSILGRLPQVAGVLSAPGNSSNVSQMFGDSDLGNFTGFATSSEGEALVRSAASSMYAWSLSVGLFVICFVMGDDPPESK